MISRIKINIIANYAGSIWSALMGLAFVPLYIKFIGIESFGLVGLFGTLIAMFSILDMGLSTTMNREMARRSGSTGEEQTCRDLLRTLETIYWIVAVIIGSIVAVLSFPIAKYWVTPDKLSTSDVQQAVMIMGLVVVFRWPLGLYQGGLMGLQKQVLVNVINAISATFRGLGAALVLWLVSPTIQAFFIFQIVVSAVETLTSAYFLWRFLPHSEERTSFRKTLLCEIWRFAGGVMGINFVSMILWQSDKIILSKMLTLEMYGYYMLAWTVAGALGKLTGPIYAAMFPHLSELVASRNMERLTDLYHKSCQFISVAVFPAACVLVLFSYEILTLWTGNPHISRQAALVTSLLVIGTACGALTAVPFAAQLAYGWTSLEFWADVVAITFLIPLLILITHIYGMIGGPLVWVTMNTAYVFIVMRVMHWRILKGELWRWYFNDVGAPFVGALAPVLIGKLLWDGSCSKVCTTIFLVLISCLSFMFAAVSAQEIRRSGMTLIRKIFSRLNTEHARASG